MSRATYVRTSVTVTGAKVVNGRGSGVSITVSVTMVVLLEVRVSMQEAGSRDIETVIRRERQH